VQIVITHLSTSKQIVVSLHGVSAVSGKTNLSTLAVPILDYTLPRSASVDFRYMLNFLAYMPAFSRNLVPAKVLETIQSACDITVLVHCQSSGSSVLTSRQSDTWQCLPPVNAIHGLPVAAY
jgi:hypothetical protein